MRVFQFLFAVFIIASCESPVRDFEKNKDELVRETSASSMNIRGKNIGFKTVDADQTVNEYYFSICGANIFLIRDSLRYNKSQIDYRDSVKQLVQTKYALLKKNGIHAYTHDFSNEGIETKFYLDDGTIVLYVPEIKKVKNKAYMNYLEKCKLIEKSLYYSTEEW
jgi:hypothetical protein